MNDIINQIIQIDSLVYENKNKNEELLFNKKKEYENKILDYKRERLEGAKIKAQAISEETDAFVYETEKSEKEIISKIIAQIHKNYEKNEKQLIDEIFSKLFVSEG